MGRSLKKFSLFIVILLLCSISPVLALQGSTDAVSFSWTKILSEPAIGIDWSPDGSSIVFGDPDSSQIGLVNWQTGEIIWRTPFPEPDDIGSGAFSARWSRDGKWIAATNAGKLYLIDPQTGYFNLLEVNCTLLRGMANSES